MSQSKLKAFRSFAFLKMCDVLATSSLEDKSSIINPTSFEDKSSSASFPPIPLSSSFLSGLMSMSGLDTPSNMTDLIHQATPFLLDLCKTLAKPERKANERKLHSRKREAVTRLKKGKKREVKQVKPLPSKVNMYDNIEEKKVVPGLAESAPMGDAPRGAQRGAQTGVAMLPLPQVLQSMSDNEKFLLLESREQRFTEMVQKVSSMRGRTILILTDVTHHRLFVRQPFPNLITRSDCINPGILVPRFVSWSNDPLDLLIHTLSSYLADVDLIRNLKIHQQPQNQHQSQPASLLLESGDSPTSDTLAPLTIESFVPYYAKGLGSVAAFTCQKIHTNKNAIFEAVSRKCTHSELRDGTLDEVMTLAETSRAETKALRFPAIGKMQLEMETLLDMYLALVRNAEQIFPSVRKTSKTSKTSKTFRKGRESSSSRSRSAWSS